MVVVAQGDTAGEGSLFAERSGILLLGDSGEENASVVSQDSGKDHDDGDWDQNPVAVILYQYLLDTGFSMRGGRWTYNNWGSL